MRGFTDRFIADDRGATAIEYAFIAMLIGVAIVTALSTLGGTDGALNNVMVRISEALDVF